MERGAQPFPLMLSMSGAHQGERFHDPVHGAFLYGSVAGEGAVRKSLGCQDAGHESHGGAAVSAVQDVLPAPVRP